MGDQKGFEPCIIPVQDHQSLVPEKFIDQKAARSGQVPMVQIGPLKEVLQDIGPGRISQFGCKEPKEGLQPSGVQPSNGPGGLSVPEQFFAVQLEIIDLLEIMVLGGHPIEGYKLLFGMGLLELFGQLDGGDDLV